VAVTGTTEILTFPDSPDVFRVTDFDADNDRMWEVMCFTDLAVAVAFADVWSRSYGRELRLGNVVPIRHALVRRRLRA
jgi:hypothetical protein